MSARDLTIPARDGFRLAASVDEPAGVPEGVVTIHAATAVPRHFYEPFARWLASEGYLALRYDYRGIGGSRPASLRGFRARARDWALLDMAGVIDWVERELAPARLLHVGHSYGGQTPGLLPNADRIDAMATVVAQSGYWGLQGRGQRLSVALHMHLTFPLLPRLIGYLPWSRLAKAEDLPKGVALDWARWCRHPEYLLGDRTLPLERYAGFAAPVLAYSIEDDGWGTPAAVDAMMRAYPDVTRRHVGPRDVGGERLGHFGFFRPHAEPLWRPMLDWLESRALSRPRDS